MRILVDTNVLFSAFMFPESMPAKALQHVINYHELVLSDQNIMELKEVVNRKKPQRLKEVEEFLERLYFEEISAKKPTVERIRDATDQPIVNAAVEKDVDIIITGDKDFLSMDIVHPKCMTAAQFIAVEMGRDW